MPSKKKISSYITFILALFIFFSNAWFFDVVFASTLPPLNASASILIDADTGVIIHQNNAHKRRYPASLTKLMTALLLLENVDNLEERIEHSVNAVFSIPRFASHIAMNDGETLSAREALYAIMLASANEVSNAIAEHIAGDLDSFAQMMTQRANELGAVNTNFENAHGLHGDNHFTTAYDMALITRELLNHPVFIEIISTRSFNIPPTERQPLDRMLNNTHRMIQPHHQAFNPDVIGGKTGFTNQAMHTLSTYARQGDAGLIAVVLENDGGHHYRDTQALLDFGFSLYTRIPVINLESFDHTIDVVQAVDSGNVQTVGSVSVAPRTNFYVSLPNVINPNNIQFLLDTRNYLTAPVSIGDVVGTARAMYNEKELGIVALITTEGFDAVYVPVQDLPVQEARLSYVPISENIDNVSEISFSDQIIQILSMVVNNNIVIITATVFLTLIVLWYIARFIARFLYKRKKMRQGYAGATVQYRGGISHSREFSQRENNKKNMRKYRYK